MAPPTASRGPVDKRDVRLVVASSVLGTTVEWYDFFLYGTAAGLVFNKLYFPSGDPLVGTLLSFATFALGFIARPVGGLVFGHIGDRVGRKKTLVATMLIMGLATCAIGLVPTYADIGVFAPVLLVLLRLAQGVAIGGEWGGAVLMAVEYAPPGRRGLYGSFPQVGLALGLMLGTGVFAALSAAMSDSAFLAWGWRIAFLLSAVLVLVGMVIRLKVMETPAFRKLQEHERESSVPVVALARDRTSRRHVLLGMGSRLTEGIAFNAWAVFAIAYGTGTLGMPEQPLLIAVMAASAVMIVFIPLFGRLSDRFGRRRTFVLGAVATGALALPTFAALGVGDPLLITVALVAVLGIAYPAMYGPQAAFYSELFPTHVRCTGISFVYQFSGIFASGFTPLVLSSLVGAAGGGYQLVVLYLVVATAVSAACAVAIRRRDLWTDAERATGAQALREAAQ
ncbi:MFS transporter [Saccharopolyspora karakumensis]|uniref:Putative proline/betaine transporter n=1 Tax=Saccharopolyspora karakumensis TaxID=2530386 RepID=A0A4R5BV80_9PSEU|nr:MFS transporter [Saccharopolyspora karakumensis]TDD89473.1 MFS transporter [Saccharopolyspora karakumensis]